MLRALAAACACCGVIGGPPRPPALAAPGLRGGLVGGPGVGAPAGAAGPEGAGAASGGASLSSHDGSGAPGPTLISRESLTKPDISTATVQFPSLRFRNVYDPTSSVDVTTF